MLLPISEHHVWSCHVTAAVKQNCIWVWFRGCRLQYTPPKLHGCLLDVVLDLITRKVKDFTEQFRVPQNFCCHVPAVSFWHVVQCVHCVTYVCAAEKPPRFRQNENTQKRPPHDNQDLQRTDIDMRWLDVSFLHFMTTTFFCTTAC